VPKQKEKRYEVAGKRLKIARAVMGKTQESILEEVRWDIVGIIDTKTIGVWEREGVPEDKLKKLADFLNVTQILLVDPKIEDEAFREIVELRKADPNANIDHLIPSKFGKDGLEGLVDEIEVPNLPLPYENLEVPWDWEEVISGARDDGTFHFYTGCKCNAEGNFDQAIFNLNKALKAGTLDGQLLFDAYYAKGYSWYKKNDLKKALTDYVESLAPESISAPIPPAYDKALNRPYKRPRFPWYGEDLPLEKINDLDAIVEDIPTRATLYYIWVIESMDMDEYDSVIDDINKAITLDPQSVHTADFLGAKGYALFQKGHYQEAVTVFSLVVDEKFNDGPEVLYFRALAYEKLNQSSDSIKDIEKCLQIDPNNELFLEKYRALS
jgi:tetratricopeptide (TPR) repeat protein